MKLSNSNLKKILIFSYILGNDTFTLGLGKKNPPRKNFLIFQEMELFDSMIKKFLKRKLFLYFGKLNSGLF